MERRNRLIIFAVIGICGISLIYLDEIRNRVVSNYTLDDKDITVINIPANKNDLTITLLLGVLLVCISIFFGIKEFLISKTSNNVLTDKLSKQEIKVQSLVKKGMTNKEIAIELSISVSTVKSHINNIYRKLDINSRQELIKLD